ncbi:hypothetical protein BDV59DRAFT_167463 [Aspergillus ambiguus]|uniref:WD40 repeat domain-containing protein n=1 Tax=Aspergillus ambiguus TaxID=176160 RepID=UPI003CCE088B
MERVSTPAFSPDGKLLAFMEQSTGTLEIWDVRNESRCTALGPHTDLKSPITWSPDGKMIACQAGYEKILVFCTRSTRLKTSFSYSTPNGWSVIGMAFSPNAKLLASIAGDYTVRAWDIISGNTMGTWRLPVYSDDLVDVRFSNDGKTIHTSNGRIDISSFYGSPKPIRNERSEDLFVDGNWIYYGNKEAIMLPYDYRARAAVVAGNTLITEHVTGDVTFFGFGDKTSDQE